MIVTRTVIVDYGMCNLDSIRRAVEECEGDPLVSSDRTALNDAERIILPGVGAFPDAMRNIRERGLNEAILRRVESGIPLLGICLGMQLLSTRGTEGEPTAGLGLFDAEVRRLEPVSGDRVPHIGWNEVDQIRASPILAGIEPDLDFYFVHSYCMACANDSDVIGRTPYCGGFSSIVQRDNIFGVQFHPEKSQKAGFRILRNFLAL